jgi:TNF receptor-associated protein 1
LTGGFNDDEKDFCNVGLQAAPSRQLAENSPYFEALKTKDVEILFCYESYDELVSLL